MRSLSSSFLCLILLAAGAAPARAQETATGAAGTDPFSQSMKIIWGHAKDNLKKSAEVAPDDLLTFKPVESVRSFGEILAHAAGANDMFCALAKGENAPSGDEEILKVAFPRAGVVRAVNESIAYCDAVFGALTDSRAADLISAWGDRTMPRATVLLLATSHLDQHYGNLVTYFRLKGIVPPSSRR